MSRTSASWASARARATRWRMPPDSSCGRLSPKPSRWTLSSSSATRPRRSALGDACAACSASSTFSRHGQPREQRRLLEHERGAAASTSTEPALRLVEPGDEVEQRGLAAARRADEAHELAARDVERDVRRARALAAGRAVDLVDAAGSRRRRAVGGAVLRDRLARATSSGLLMALPTGALALRLEHLVEQRQVVDARQVDRVEQAERRSASFADFCSDEAIGSTVNSRFFQAASTTRPRAASAGDLLDARRWRRCWASVGIAR